MALLDRTGLIADRWVRVADGDAVPDHTDILVPLARALAEPALLARNGGLGVVLDNTVDVATLEPVFSRLSLIALTFPAYRDGRAYSQAVRLRQELRFGGELRAIGAVLPDQVHFMARAGFDTFEIADAAKAPVFLAALARHRHVYQQAADSRVPVPVVRHASIREAAE